MRSIAVVALLLLSAAPALADETTCTRFKWPLATEKSWFESAGIARKTSGAQAPSIPDNAFELTLAAAQDVKFVLPPEGKPKADRPLGGIMSFEKIQAGHYQVTLSAEAWIDVVQAGAYRNSLEFSGVHGCPGLRKSVRFMLNDGALTLQLSAATDTPIKVAIRRID